MQPTLIGIVIDDDAIQRELENDELFGMAVKVVVSHRRASVSLIQRHLRLGYNRSSRLLDAMENSGIVSAMKNDGTRDVLLQTVPQLERKS